MFVQHNSTIQRINTAGSASPTTFPFPTFAGYELHSNWEHCRPAFKLPLGNNREPLQEGTNTDLQKKKPLSTARQLHLSPSVPSCRAAISSPVQRRKNWLHCKGSSSFTSIYHRHSRRWCGESPGRTGRRLAASLPRLAQSHCRFWRCTEAVCASPG